MAKKIRATKTINPLHFEDLEPHRFEDLVRRLLYTFRDWSNIEATGRGGADDGFDVRAWERADEVTNVSDEGEEGSRSMDGNLWQIQGKREKSITLKKLRQMIKEGVDAALPPHGYILAAATNISKPAYDAFREELKKKGVREFYFWGKDYLEDQLALPQNDEILFTFFGLSLSPRRRSRVSEIKFALNNKNKIQRLLFGSERPQSTISSPRRFLLRDIKDAHYPQDDAYPDFEQHRRWEEHEAVHVTPKGIYFRAREWYAYLDEPARVWDFTRAVDTTPRTLNLDAANRARLEDAGKLVDRYWRHLPRRVQAKFKMFGFVRFDNMLIVDDKGDADNADPHIFIDFSEKHGPFEYISVSLVHQGQIIHGNELSGYTKKEILPSDFPKIPKRGAVHEMSALGLAEVIARRLEHLRGASSLYGFDKKLDRLKDGDLIHVPANGQHSSEKYEEVTHIESTTVKAFLKQRNAEGEYLRTQLREHAGREIKDIDRLTICEVQSVMIMAGADGSNFLYYTD